ncbi:hypothetical protein BSL78_07088 [Apostichopus japonicus]|uniref:Uncharacterized protein n=1 Tax=Stichopus japonicus TaxID=307972 RepID=A0A2G8L744_STIJA|nr:hypothetical protein BSL78_07088 [Apostichopus japonicus]
MKKGGKIRRKNGGHSISSTDTEDMVKLTHKGLDRCASLLAHIMDDGQRGQRGDMRDRCDEKEKQPRMGKTKEINRKQKMGKQPNQRKVKRKVSKGQERQKLRIKVDQDNDMDKPEQSQRTTYQPELMSSTPQLKLPRAVSQHTCPQGITNTQETLLNQFEVKGQCYQGSEPVRYPSSHGFNPGLIGGQMIPERERAREGDDLSEKRQTQNVQALYVSTDRYLASGREEASGIYRGWSDGGCGQSKLRPDIFSPDQRVQMDPATHPLMHVEQEGSSSRAGYSLYRNSRDDTAPVSGVNAAKSVLRDLVDTLKSINERDAVSFQTKSREQQEVDRKGSKGVQTDHRKEVATSEDPHVRQTKGEDGERRGECCDNFDEKKMISETQEEQRPIISSDSQSKVDGSQASRSSFRNGTTEEASIKENPLHEDVEINREKRFTLQNEGENGQVVQTESGCRNDECKNEKSPTMSRRSGPETKKRRKTRSEEFSGKSSKSKDKKPLLEQQRVLKYLVTELKAVTEGKGNLEADNLFHNILDTIDTLPYLTMDKEVQIEIAMALQPLRSENASLRRKLRIANQQMKEIQREIEGRDERNLQNSETSAVKTLNVTLQEQLIAEQQECGALKKLVSKLQDDLKATEGRYEDLTQHSKQKDECHLRSQRDWMSETATLRKQQTCSKQELETTRLKLEALKKKTSSFQNNLTETRRHLEKADQTTQWLEGMLARLAPGKDDPVITELVTTREEHSLTPGQSRFHKPRTSPKRKREKEMRELKASLKLKRDGDDSERRDTSTEIPPSDAIGHYFGGARTPVDNKGSHSRLSGLENEDRTRRPSLFREEGLDEDNFDEFQQSGAHFPSHSERAPAETTSRGGVSKDSNVLHESHDALQLCDEERTLAGISRLFQTHTLDLMLLESVTQNMLNQSLSVPINRSLAVV